MCSGASATPWDTLTSSPQCRQASRCRLCPRPLRLAAPALPAVPARQCSQLHLVTVVAKKAPDCSAKACKRSVATHEMQG